MARLLRRARLLKPGDFESTFKSGSRLSEKWLTAVVAANPLGHPRLGLAVAKKSVRLATARNRIKRCIRESFRARQPRLAGVDIVILTRSGCADIPNAELRDCLDRLWNRIHARCAPSSSA
ncbi:MAG: ribonuclease P protein component [Gammaproteobacteria bacterium]